MARLPGRPVMVVSDDDRSITAAVASQWPATFHKRCEHHLRVNSIKKLQIYGQTSYGDPTMELLNDAFSSRAGWEAFKTGAPRGVEVQDWIWTWKNVLDDQTTRRPELPQHHTTGAIDPALARIREFMAARAFSYRNAERTTRMLELVRLRLNRNDDPTAYATAIREHLAANGGRLGGQLVIRDRRGQPSLRN